MKYYSPKYVAEHPMDSSSITSVLHFFRHFSYNKIVKIKFGYFDKVISHFGNQIRDRHLGEYSYTFPRNMSNVKINIVYVYIYKYLYDRNKTCIRD